MPLQLLQQNWASQWPFEVIGADRAARIRHAIPGVGKQSGKTIVAPRHAHREICRDIRNGTPKNPGVLAVGSIVQLRAAVAGDIPPAQCEALTACQQRRVLQRVVKKNIAVGNNRNIVRCRHAVGGREELSKRRQPLQRDHLAKLRILTITAQALRQLRRTPGVGIGVDIDE